MSHKKTDVEFMLKMKLDLAKVQAQMIKDENDAGGVTHRSEGSDYVPTPRAYQPSVPPRVISKTRTILNKDSSMEKKVSSEQDFILRKEVIKNWNEVFGGSSAPKQRRHSK